MKKKLLALFCYCCLSLFCLANKKNLKKDFNEQNSKLTLIFFKDQMPEKISQRYYSYGSSILSAHGVLPEYHAQSQTFISFIPNSKPIVIAGVRLYDSMIVNFSINYKIYKYNLEKNCYEIVDHSKKSAQNALIIQGGENINIIPEIPFLNIYKTEDSLYLNFITPIVKPNIFVFQQTLIDDIVLKNNLLSFDFEINEFFLKGIHEHIASNNIENAIFYRCYTGNLLENNGNNPEIKYGFEKKKGGFETNKALGFEKNNKHVEQSVSEVAKDSHNNKQLTFKILNTICIGEKKSKLYYDPKNDVLKYKVELKIVQIHDLK
ncbi:hypothetical protein AAEX28_07585 [Lentisphaerota bacterium WC36G]|nr:hypothetical protein LJT99_10445 [Lentisphaerae bacterium WC36]